jgi:CubicO group peptidase (beta-lactamase class C family)
VYDLVTSNEELAITTATEVHGACDERFAAVRDAFAENFAAGLEVGAAVAVVVDGQTVVDLWAGHADEARTVPWQRDTIVNVYSSTKGVVATCAHRLVDQGLLDLDAPVARYWPEFAQAGKESIPVRYLLSHTAGLPAVEKMLPLGSSFQWDTMTQALAEQAPWWQPGSKHGYHTVSFGWLVGEVIRRVSGKSVGAYFRDEIAAPLGLDFHIGLGEEHDARTASVIAPEMPDPGDDNPITRPFRDPTSMQFKSVFNPPDLVIPGLANSRSWRAAEIPAANGHGDARSLARLYGALARGGEVDGVRVLSGEAIDRAIEEQAVGVDAILGIPMRWGLGFGLTHPDRPLGPNPRAFGHAGMGGSIGWADPDAKLGFGYVMNRLEAVLETVDPRWPSLFDAVYASL